jgi:hypothetical protein
VDMVCSQGEPEDAISIVIRSRETLKNPLIAPLNATFLLFSVMA